MDIVTYFSRSVLILIAFVLLYLIAFRRDGHFNLYRMFLLTGLLSTMLMPFAVVNYTITVAPVQLSEAYKEVHSVGVGNPVNIGEKTPAINWWNIITGFYFFGVFVFILRIIAGLLRVIVLRYKCTKKKVEGITYFIGDHVSEPFTFGSFIFIDSKSFAADEESAIIAHEKVHVNQHHWLDALLSELLIVMQWFNPLAWYYGKLVKQNLEFIADQGVLRRGYSLEKYIQSIISITMGAEASVLANHFRFSQNKKRLKMMKNVRKSKWKQLKLLLVLPLLGGFLWSFSEPVYRYDTVSKVDIKESSQKQKEKFLIKGQVSSQVTDTMEIRQNDGTWLTKLVHVKLPGATIIIKGTTKGAVADEKGNFSLEVSKGDDLVVSYVGFETKIVSVKHQNNLDVQLRWTAYELDPSMHYESSYKKADYENSNEEHPRFIVVEELPYYKNGNDVFFKNLEKLVKEANSKDNSLSGVVKVNIYIDESGKIDVSIPDIVQTRKENMVAIDLVSSFKDWVPGKQRGKPVPCSVVVPVDFGKR